MPFPPLFSNPRNTIFLQLSNSILIMATTTAPKKTSTPKASSRGPPSSASKPVVVIKIGTSTIMRDDLQQTPSSSAYSAVAMQTLEDLAAVIIRLRNSGVLVVLVSSGAVGVGKMQLGAIASTTPEPQNKLARKQALASIGQSILMGIYASVFQKLSYSENDPLSTVHVAQILLGRTDFGSRTQYINAQNTLNELLSLGVVPIVNENDTVATEELKFGDNDTLSAFVAGLVDASWLFLMTDVAQMYTHDPRQNPDAAPIRLVNDIETLEVDLGKGNTGGSSWGTGGMATKITAARLAVACGVNVVITHGRMPEIVLDYVLPIRDGYYPDIQLPESGGTWFVPQKLPLTKSRKKWIATALKSQGDLVVDQGAAKAVSQKKSLFVAGIKAVKGTFARDAGITVVDLNGNPLARGLVNFSSQELDLIKGLHSKDAAVRLGYDVSEEAIHRDNLVLL